jgi:spoIIIJ-associated protein
MTLEWVETTGRTVEEAKRAALEQLGVGEADVEVEVVAEPRLGLFGRLKEEARVRARLVPRYPRAKGERRERRRGAAADRERGRRAANTSATGTAPARSSGNQARLLQDRATRQANSAKAPQTRGTGDGASVPHVDNAPPHELARLGEEFLRGLLERLGSDAAISSHVKPDGLVELTVKGDDLGFLIGPKGTTLLALQELTRTVVQRRTPHTESRLVVDVNDYRKRRHEALARFAKQVAQQVLATNTRRALEPMPPADRKVVHDAVNEVPGVTTASEGEEPNRRVVILPEELVGGATSAQEAPEAGDGPSEAALSGPASQ